MGRHPPGEISIFRKALKRFRCMAEKHDRGVNVKNGFSLVLSGRESFRPSCETRRDPRKPEPRRVVHHSHQWGFEGPIGLMRFLSEGHSRLKRER